MEDYEKKYKEALERAKDYIEKQNPPVSVLYEIFPELKNKDEEIRKALIKGVESCKASGWTNFGNNVDIDVVLAWLKEQGKQKPIDYNKELKKCRENPLYFFDKYVKLEKQKPACSEEDERVKKRILLSLEKDLMATKNSGCDTQDLEQCIAWLEKQGESYTKKDIDDAYLKGISDAKDELEKQGTPAKLSEEEQNSFAKGVLSSCALSFINYLDAHSYEGKMCVSNLECEDIENAFHNAMWDRLHRYYCKYIEKQGEQKSVLDFKASNWYVSKVDGKIHDMLKDRVQPKPKEWGEEDENYLQSAENACEYQYGKNTSTILWLKSLKERNTWKPSKEQMEALDDALNERGFDYNDLNSLYEQLKKL